METGTLHLRRSTLGRSPHRRRRRRRALGSALNGLIVLVGAALLLWPAAFNAYPIVFSDTGGLLEMGLRPAMGWDKPFVYGPLLAALSLRLTLWLPLVAQAAALSYALWRVQTAFAPSHPLRHLALCLLLSVATPAPWFASTLMPDAFTAVAALCLVAAALRPGAVIIVAAAIAIASHLSHLVLAAALIAALAATLRRIPWGSIASLAAALLFLVASNWIGHGRPAVSPYGAVFALARLVADGPARRYLDQACPTTHYILCVWRDRLTDDSDQFLWDPAGPFWADPAPLPQFADDAAQIVRATILSDPAAVLRDAYRNTAAQLARADIGDTLRPDNLADAVRPRVARWYPSEELRRFDESRQIAGTLELPAARLIPLHRAAMLLGLAACTLILLRTLGRRSARADLAALLLIALAANAFATGALSSVHDRYQARIAWLIVLPVLLRFPARPAYAARAATASGVIRTSASYSRFNLSVIRPGV